MQQQQLTTVHARFKKKIKLFTANAIATESKTRYTRALSKHQLSSVFLFLVEKIKTKIQKNDLKKNFTLRTQSNAINAFRT